MCGCNKKVKRPTKKESTTKTVLRKIWEKSQTEQKPLIVKEINKQ